MHILSVFSWSIDNVAMNVQVENTNYLNNFTWVRKRVSTKRIKLFSFWMYNMIFECIFLLYWTVVTYSSCINVRSELFKLNSSVVLTIYQRKLKWILEINNQWLYSEEEVDTNVFVINTYIHKCMCAYFDVEGYKWHFTKWTNWLVMHRNP